MTRTGRSRYRLPAILAAGIVAIGLLGAYTEYGSASPAARISAASQAGTARPNVVFILTDDLDLKEISVMPHLKALIADQGTTFTNYFVTDSLCCPSRSSILRGQYVHNHGVLGNGKPDGGYQKFHSTGDETSTIGTWLQAAGYRTALMGKYLNGYPDTVAPTFVPPGWNEWDSPAAGSPYSEYDYTFNENGTLVRHGHAPEDYMVDLLAGKANTFVTATPAQPFFLYLATYAPHQPATAAPRYADAFPGVQAPRTPSFNESDMSDKPDWLKNAPLMTDAVIARVDELYRKRLQSLLGVDDLIAGLIQTLQQSGQLDNTYFVFTSDNGFHLGQHRMPSGKQTAFDEDIHVPLIVRGPGVPAGRQQDALTMEIDLAPTFAALGGATAPDFVDGRSLVPLLRGDAAPATWRQGVLVEHYSSAGGTTSTGAASTVGVPDDPDDDDAWFEMMPVPGATATAGTVQTSATQATTAKKHKKADGKKKKPGATAGQGGKKQAKRKLPIPTYSALRTADYTYVEYTGGARELYDLHKDPDELQNIAATADPALLGRLAAQLGALRSCSGVSCQ